MENVEKLLSVLFGEQMEMEIKASDIIEDMKKRYNISENGIAEHYVHLAKCGLKRLSKLYYFDAPKEILESQYNIISQHIYVIAVVAFKNTLQVDYYEKLMNDKGIDFEALE